MPFLNITQLSVPKPISIVNRLFEIVLKTQMEAISMSNKYIPSFDEEYTHDLHDFLEIYPNPRIYYEGAPEPDEDPADFYRYVDLVKAVSIA